jgi:chromosomal replication initiator protein
MIEENSYVLSLALEIANAYSKEEIEKMIESKTSPKGMNLNNYILDLVCSVMEVNVEDVKKRSRRYEINLSRQMVMYFIRKFNETISLKGIGIFLGNRDHSTIINGIRQMEGYLYLDDVKRKFDFIEGQIKATLECKI